MFTQWLFIASANYKVNVQAFRNNRPIHLEAEMTLQEEILQLALRMEQAPEAVEARSIDAATHGRLLSAARQLIAALEAPETELMNIAKAVRDDHLIGMLLFSLLIAKISR